MWNYADVTFNLHKYIVSITNMCTPILNLTSLFTIYQANTCIILYMYTLYIRTQISHKRGRGLNNERACSNGHRYMYIFLTYMYVYVHTTLTRDWASDQVYVCLISQTVHDTLGQ